MKHIDINIFKKEFDQNVNKLKDPEIDEETKKVLEEEISKNLDEYLINVGSNLMELPIQILHRIFNNPERNLNNNNLFYELIKEQFNKTREKDIYILLQSIDGLKLDKKYLEESFKLAPERDSMMPKINYSYIEEFNKRVQKLEELIQQKSIQEMIFKEFNEIKSILEEKMDNYQKCMNEEINQKINLMNNQQDNYNKECRKQIEEIDKEVKDNNSKQNENYLSFATLIKNQKTLDEMNFDLKLSELDKKLENNQNIFKIYLPIDQFYLK